MDMINDKLVRIHYNYNDEDYIFTMNQYNFNKFIAGGKNYNTYFESSLDALYLINEPYLFENLQKEIINSKLNIWDKKPNQYTMIYYSHNDGLNILTATDYFRFYH